MHAQAFRRTCIILAFLFWAASFYLLYKVKDGRRIFLLNFVLMLAALFVVPAVFTRQIQLGIVYWMPLSPVIYGFVMLIFSALIRFVKEDNERSPLPFSLVGTALALGLEGWLFYFLTQHAG